MPDTTQYHADMLRMAISLGGAVEIHEAGCDSPQALVAADVLTLPLPDRTAGVALRQARQRTLVAAAGLEPDLARVGQRATEEANLIVAAWARCFAGIEARGGQVSYRGAQ